LTAAIGTGGRREPPLDVRARGALDAALDWVCDHLDDFHLEEVDGIAVPEGMKGVTELAVMTATYAAHFEAAEEPRVLKTLQFLRSVQDDTGVGDYLVRSPRHFVVYATLFGALRKLGHEQRDRRNALAMALAERYHAQIERPPHRVMDVRLVLEWCGLEGDLPTLETLAMESIEFRGASPLYLDDVSVYDLTHSIMFRCGFGTRPDGLADLPERVGRDELLRTLVLAYVQRRHWDLVAELLLCLICVHRADDETFTSSLEALLSAQAPDGSILGCRGAPGTSEEREREHDVGFEHTYHTTLVAVMLLSAYVSHAGKEPRLTSPRQHAAVRPLGARPSFAPALQWLQHVVGHLDGVLGSSIDEGTAGGERAHAAALALLGIWICSEQLADTTAEAALDAASRSFGRWWQESERAVGSDELLASVVAASAGHPSGVSLSAVAGRVRDADTRSRPARELSVALSALLGASDQRPTPSAPWHYAHLPLGPAEIEALLLDAELECTGGRSTTSEADRRRAQDALTGVAVCQLRSYELSRGCRTLRLLAAVTEGGWSELLTHALGFLAMQQRPDGCFGYFGPELGAYERRRDTDPLFIRLHLPVTVACLWTAAELLQPSWRLYPALGRLVTAGLRGEH